MFHSAKNGVLGGAGDGRAAGCPGGAERGGGRWQQPPLASRGRAPPATAAAPAGCYWAELVVPLGY